jgi:hypothetical protein
MQPEVRLASPFTDKQHTTKTGPSLMDEDVIGKDAGRDEALFVLVRTK